LPFLLALVAICWCLHVARKHQLRDVVALTTLTLLLLVCAIPATAQIVLPAFAYLTQWLEIVGGLVWFTVGWTVWRTLVEPWLDDTSRHRRRIATTIATATLAFTVAVSWRPAVDVEQPAARASTLVEALGPQLAANVPHDRRLRIEVRGDFTATPTVGVIYWLIDHHYDVVTSDGGIGLKWGHTHLWKRGDHYDLLLTAALDHAVSECEQDPSARRLASHDSLDPDERAWLTGYQLRRLAGPDTVTAAETRRAEKLAPRDQRLAVFAGPHLCASTDNPDFGRSNSGWLLPTAVAALATAACALTALLLRRRRPARP
jgi:hypothetical protein